MKKHKCKAKQSKVCMECGKAFAKVWHLNQDIKQVYLYNSSKLESVNRSKGRLNLEQKEH